MSYGGFQLIVDGTCILCHATAVPVLAGAKGDDVSNVGICEPCSRLADWRFRDVSAPELAGVPFPTTPGAALVLIVRDRFVDGHPDTLCPRDVLMVERTDEPGKFGLPGGKLERGESPREAAVRELGEETSVLTWGTALEDLYSGFSARGKLVDTFLCRAWSGEVAQVPGEGSVEWKPWPPSNHVGVLRGYYRGLEISWEARLRLRKEIGNEPPLCQHLGKSGLTYVVEGLSQGGGDRAFMGGLHYVMTEEEKQASKFVLREVTAPKPPEAEQAKEPSDDAAASEGGGEGGGDDVEPSFNNDEREGPA